MQHEQTFGALAFAGLTVGEAWLHYVNMGGDIGETEVDAYLHGMMDLPSQERNCLSRAVNELIDDMLAGNPGSLYRAPYSPKHSNTKRFPARMDRQSPEAPEQLIS